MPTRLSFPNTPLGQQELAEARALDQRLNQTLTIGPPWGGYTPDGPVGRLGYQAAVNVEGLVVRTLPNIGEVLTHDAGWERIDPDRLPLGSAWVDPGGGVAQPIVGIGNFPRRIGAADPTVIPIVVTQPLIAATGHVFGLNPTTGQWQEIVHSGDANSTPITAGTREDLVDWTVFPAGASTRAGGTGHPGPAITQPIFIFTNYLDPVYVFPETNSGSDYEDLDLTNSGSGITPFRCQSVEVYAGRVHYLATVEAGAVNDRRWRWSPVGDANPDPAGLGAGAKELVQFRRKGMKLKRLGDLLAIYFEDGVALVRKQGQVQTSPFVEQYSTTERGLISTHALAEIDANTHFGIFTDGWWFFNSAGEWSEVGVVEFEGVRVHRFKETFYRRLDIDKRHRTTVQYDPAFKFVRIAFPTIGITDNEEVWIYDMEANRVWVDRYPVTQWGSIDRQIVTAYTWGTGTPGAIPTTILWSTITGTWISLAPRFGLEAPVHGDLNGLVFQHDYDVISRDGELPIYLYESHELPNVGSNRWNLVDLISMEYVNVDGPMVTLEAMADEGIRFDGGGVSMSEGVRGQSQNAYRGVRISGHHLGLRFSGIGPVAIRSLEVDMILDRIKDRRQP